ncbi:ATP-dependent dethiobiotin synthetase BioD [Nonomuraea fastidiosa]|uniref:ATP-dependent dethiobiotin synthetase BioD n=1 Tax=Nonomuraea TaxID=83681 RepID=UPI0032484348
MSVLVVAGTGTGVGKTVVVAAVAALAVDRGADVAVVKPAQTGAAPLDDGDVDRVMRLSGVRTTFELSRFPDALPPAAAARACEMPPASMASAATLARELAESNRLVLVEGTGGLLDRYDEDGATIADLARTLRAQVLVVVGAGPARSTRPRSPWRRWPTGGSTWRGSSSGAGRPSRGRRSAPPWPTWRCWRRGPSRECSPTAPATWRALRRSSTSRGAG